MRPIRAFIPKRSIMAALEAARQPKKSTPAYLEFKAWLRKQQQERTGTK